MPGGNMPPGIPGGPIIPGGNMAGFPMGMPGAPGIIIMGGGIMCAPKLARISCCFTQYSFHAASLNPKLK
ncbi:hypothetical protein H4R21_002890 [Coemansia helicoidea]|uniref:Uncharacterized protein n=1 Tax=Coemansia helicoidea TaxID=1286919 RepID=A0ACC1L563_9FUNG|nr:hypothetical protein H4R21_002890 [Coemansia helicoidea]